MMTAHAPLFRSLLSTIVGLISLPCWAASPASVEQLPVDRFDEYPPGAFPPHPWKQLGASAPDLTLTLEPSAESPFPGNTVHGKGFLLRDRSSSAGKGSGFGCDFVETPAGDVYLGFDFQLGPDGGEKGLGLQVDLTDASNRGLQLRLSRQQGLQVRQADGTFVPLCPLVPGKWYHLGVTISPDRKAVFRLFTPDGKISNLPTDRVPVVFPEHGPFQFQQLALAKDSVRLPEGDGFSSLRFTSLGEEADQGSWMIDHITMAGQVDADRTAWLPFKRDLRPSDRKVLAYYYPIYPSGLSSQDTGLGWYPLSTLNAAIPIDPKRLEAGTKYFYHPLPRVPLKEGLSEEEELLLGREEEIRLARQMGLDGFIVDFFAQPREHGGQHYFNRISFTMLDAASRGPEKFSIIPAVYAGREEADPVEYANSPVFKKAWESPATLRTADGRMIISMWLTERQTPEWWKKALAELEHLGYPSVLLTQFNSMNRLEDFSDVAMGMSNWGPRTPLRTKWVEEARKYTKLVVAPIATHDIRSRGSIFWEAENFDTLRRTWMTAIEDNADWVCINTWSDYSEQAMAPSTAIGFALYDLSAYYAQWFKTGQAPEIIRDVFYYSYRRHHSSLEPAHGKKWKAVKVAGKDTAEDQIELLAFLKEPGELTIRIGDEKFRKKAEAGIVSFKVPLPPNKAFTPEFGLERDGRSVIRGFGRYAILDRIEYPNMLYHSGVLIGPEN
jgi:hypothetical protein